MWGGEELARASVVHLSRLGFAYRVTPEQLDAVGWYTSPQNGWLGGGVPKTEDDAFGQLHVAHALAEALRRLPSARDLGSALATFRVVGCAETDERASQIGDLREGTVIIHGARHMKNRSHHFMSTSITPNVKGFSMNLPKAGEVLAIYGGSGRYIQWLGRHSLAMDGGEVLYPPGTVTRFCGKVAEITVHERTRVPVYLLVECDPAEVARAENVVEDFQFQGPPEGLDLMAAIRTRYATPRRIGGNAFEGEQRRFEEELRQREELRRRAENIFRGIQGSSKTGDPRREAFELAREKPGPALSGPAALTAGRWGALSFIAKVLMSARGQRSRATTNPAPRRRKKKEAAHSLDAPSSGSSSRASI